MARPRSAEIATRDMQIRSDAENGMSKTSIAAKYGISITRVCQILASEVEVADEAQRAWLLANYQGGMNRLEEIIKTPGRPITSGAGKHVIDDTTGLPAFDPSPVVDAIRTKAQYLKNMAQLLGSEKIPLKPVEESADFHEALDVMRTSIKRSTELERENAALRQRLAVLENRDLHEAEIVE